MKRQLYLVLLDWSTMDDEGLETYLYANFEDARNKFRQLIEDEHDPDISWIGDIFDENGEVEGYDFDCNDYGDEIKDLFWHVVDKDNYYRHTFIDLKIMEVL